MDTFSAYFLSLTVTLIFIFIPPAILLIVAGTPELIEKINTKKFILCFVVINCIFNTVIRVVFFDNTKIFIYSFLAVLFCSIGLYYSLSWILNKKYNTCISESDTSYQSKAVSSIKATQTKDIKNIFDDDDFEEILPFFTYSEEKPHNKKQKNKTIKTENKFLLSPKTKNIVIIVLSVTLVLSCVGLFAQNRYYKQISSLTNELNNQIELLNKKIVSQEKIIDEKSDMIKETENKNQENNEKLRFYEQYAVCVGENDKYFHKYGCIKFDSSSFYIFNKEAAEDQGYFPCPFCKKGYIVKSDNETTTRKSFDDIISERENQKNEQMVYITPTGKRYHLDPDCGGKNSYSAKLTAAQSRGLTPCKKCAR